MRWNLDRYASRAAGSLLMKCAILLCAVLGATSLTTSSVYATLIAKARTTIPQSVTTGTLSLTMTTGLNSGTTDGFIAPIVNMAAGDGVVRFVDITLGGSLSGSTLYLVGTPSETATALLTDVNSGLRLSVEECDLPYSSSGNCSSTVYNDLTSTAYATVGGRFRINTYNLTPGRTIYLKILFRLPGGNEFVQDGVLPTGSLQGLTQNITWSFEETVANGTSIS